MNGVNQKNFGLFFKTLSDLKAAQLLIKTGKSDKDVIKIILSKFMKPHHIRKSNMKPKFFLQISDHQQIVAPAPSRGLPHTPISAGGR
jgi:hypothetical protein